MAKKDKEFGGLKAELEISKDSILGLKQKIKEKEAKIEELEAEIQDLKSKKQDDK